MKFMRSLFGAEKPEKPLTCVPWSHEVDTPEWNVKRRLCAAVNHEPRKYDGSWCQGYDYVCSRCASWVDPWSPAKNKAVVDAANRLGEHGGSELIANASSRLGRP